MEDDMSKSPDSMAPSNLPGSGNVNNHNISPHIFSSFDSPAQPAQIAYNAPPGASDIGSLALSHFQMGQFQYQSRHSISNLSDSNSPMHVRQQRMSTSSNGPFMTPMQIGSLDDSDVLSPDSSFMGQGSVSGDISGAPLTAVTSVPNITSRPSADSDRRKSKDDKGDGTPQWAELKTKAGKERKRLPLACIACRRKKIRCSGEKPACKHCVRSHIPCVYKVTTRKAAPRTDYMAMLDKRLKRMEERVIRIMPKDEQRNVETIGRAVVKPAVPGPLPKSTDKKRGADEAFGQELDEWSRSKPKGTAQGSRQSKLVPKDKLLVEGAEHLPSQELQQYLAEVFFDYVYGQGYHLLHKPSYMRKLDAGKLPPVLSLSVCAISARFATHPQIRTEPAYLRGEQWAKPAREICLKRYDTPNITILISYVILGLHEFGTCHGGRSWMFGGMAQRMAYALMLHKDLEDDQPRGAPDDGVKFTFTDREIRRRTMWSCFIMDRFNSSGTNRPLFVSEQYIEAQLPIVERFFQMEITGPTETLEGNVPKPVEPDAGQITNAKDNMGVAAYTIRLVAMWGHTIRYLNLGGKERDLHPIWSDKSTFKELRTDIEKWRATLPESLHWNLENLQNHSSEKIANQFILLHIVNNQITLFLNRFALPYPGARQSMPTAMPQHFVTSCARSALESANQISILVKEAMDHRVVAPFAGYCAFLSGTVHVPGLFARDTVLVASSKRYLAYNVKFLTMMKKHWGMFHSVTEQLKDLYRRAADAAGQGSHAASTPSGQKPQEHILQYGDWFDRYPNGVSGTDYEDAAIEVKNEPGSDAVLGQQSDLQSVEEFFARMSPPSRAAQQKRNARKKRTKSEAARVQIPEVVAGQDGMLQDQVTQNQQHHHAQGPHMDAGMPHSSFTGSIPYDLQASQPHSFQGDLSNDMPLLQAQQNYRQQQGVLSQQQLDRHLVLSSYAGIDPSVDMTDPTDSRAGLSEHGNLFDLDVGSFDFGSNPWDQSSAAWFMPFNMDPPNNISDDSGLFGGVAYDFNALNMQGFGDIGALGTGQDGQGDASEQGGGMME